MLSIMGPIFTVVYSKYAFNIGALKYNVIVVYKKCRKNSKVY